MSEQVVERHDVALVGCDSHGIVAIIGSGIDFKRGLEEQRHFGSIAICSIRHELVRRKRNFSLGQFLTYRLRIIRVHFIIASGHREQQAQSAHAKYFFLHHFSSRRRVVINLMLKLHFFLGKSYRKKTIYTKFLFPDSIGITRKPLCLQKFTVS